MGAKKVHVYKGKKVWYTALGRSWHVQDGTNTVSFEDVEGMLKKHPELIAVPSVEAAAQRRAERKLRPGKGEAAERKKEPLEKSDLSPKGPNEKLVTCYYCSGKGRTGFGMLCPNCGGKGRFIVSGKGIWD